MLKNIYKEDFSFWEIYSASVDLFSKKFKNILLITLIIYIPINVILYFASEALLSSPEVSFGDYVNFMKIAGWLEQLIWVIASIFVIFTVKESLDNSEKTFWEILKLSFSKWWSAIWANILYSIWVWLLLLLLIIPWLIFAVYWIFFIYVIVLKDISATKSFEYSKKMVKWRWWEIFGYWCFSFFWVLAFWFLMWFTPYLDNIFVDVTTSIAIDLVYLFMVIIFTLKFINIDKNIVEEWEDKKLENKKEIMSNVEL